MSLCSAFWCQQCKIVGCYYVCHPVHSLKGWNRHLDTFRIFHSWTSYKVGCHCLLRVTRLTLCNLSPIPAQTPQGPGTTPSSTPHPRTKEVSYLPFPEVLPFNHAHNHLATPPTAPPIPDINSLSHASPSIPGLGPPKSAQGTPSRHLSQFITVSCPLAF